MIGPGNKYEGTTSAKRVMWFQDWSFMINDEPARRLTDEQLLREWRSEFPYADGKVFRKSFEDGLQILRAVRAHYNVGRQGHGHRSGAGDLLGGARALSLPYDTAGRVFWYSDRWLGGILKARPEFVDPR